MVQVVFILVVVEQVVWVEVTSVREVVVQDVVIDVVVKQVVSVDVISVRVVVVQIVDVDFCVDVSQVVVEEVEDFVLVSQ